MGMKLPRIKFGRPQQLAALLLLVFLAECLWVVSRQQLSQQDYRYAECGREMWERPSPLAGYFTTCGNLNGDGTFAYRVAGLPLTMQRLAMLGADKLRKPENRLYAQGSLSGTTWEYSVATALWNGEDLSVVAADGTENPSAPALVRPYPRAVAGSAVVSSFDTASRALTLTSGRLGRA